MLEDFIIADMTETDDAQIILGRPFLATAGFHIDSQITFEVQMSNAMFCYMEEKAFPPHSSLSDAFPPFSRD